MTRPDKTIAEVWRQSAAWAAAAREGQEEQASARQAVLGLTVGAAFAVAFGQAYGIYGGWTGHASLAWAGQLTTRALTTAAAVMMVAATYFSKQLLTPDRETAWAKARMLREALKRECWKALLRVPPYDGEGAGAALEAKASALIAKVGAVRRDVNPKDLPPEATTIEHYLARRAREQLAWYEAKAIEARREQLGLEQAAFWAGFVPAALAVVAAGLLWLQAFVPAFTTLAASLMAWVQATRVAYLAPAYQEASTQLAFVLAAWDDAAAVRAAMTPEQLRAAECALVTRCEEIMAAENDSWRLEWLADDKVAEALAVVNGVAQEPPA